MGGTAIATASTTSLIVAQEHLLQVVGGDQTRADAVARLRFRESWAVTSLEVV